ncbi:hypothetical protein NIES4071_46700 [Calothrix sp. NIES-4071]|nr:hypothetical protein NIES4071_46700 [Calothrix sp. NIES-4071]BAZ58981.1 hypothetical protein NIES4105_46630 [Calothrix sp. NIES-4105]
MTTIYPIRLLGELVEVKGGKRLPKGEQYSTTLTKHPYLRVCDFISGSIDETNLREESVNFDAAFLMLQGLNQGSQ